MIPGTRGWLPLNPRLVQTVEESIPLHTGYQHVSARSVDRTLHMPWKTVRKIVGYILKLNPYKGYDFTAIKTGYLQQRIDFAHFITFNIDVDQSRICKILCSDEDQFAL